MEIPCINKVILSYLILSQWRYPDPKTSCGLSLMEHSGTPELAPPSKWRAETSHMSLSRECIIGPHQALDGILTTPHIQLNPPSCHQLKMVVKCYLYAIDLDKAISCLWWMPFLCSNPKLSNRMYWTVHFPTIQHYWSVLSRRCHQMLSPAYLCPSRYCDLLHFQRISWRWVSSNVTRCHCKALLGTAPYGWPICRDPYWTCTWL